MLGSGGSSIEGGVMVDTKRRKDLMADWGSMTAVKRFLRAEWNDMTSCSAANPHSQRRLLPQYPTLLLFPTPWGPPALCSLEVESPD